MPIFYEATLSPDELELWNSDAIPQDCADEIKIVKLQIRRALMAQIHCC